MRYLLFLIFILTSCSQALDKPKNLLTEKQMSSLIAEFAIVDQMSFIAPNANAEIQTRYILKKYNIKAVDFKESYTYYTGTNELKKIFSDAQSIIIDKDPKAKEYIDKKLKVEKIPSTVGR